MSARRRGDMGDAVSGLLGARAKDPAAPSTEPAPAERQPTPRVASKSTRGPARAGRTAVTTRLPHAVATDLSRVWIELRAEFPGLEKQDLLAAVLATYVHPGNLMSLRSLVAEWQRDQDGADA